MTLALTLLLACDVDTPDVTTTWHRDVRPIVEASCLDCHTPGGVGPFSLHADDVSFDEGTPWWAAAAVNAVEARRMPPWHAADDCHPIADAAALPQADVDAFTAWRDAGYPEGDPAAFVARATATGPDPGPPDLSLDGGSPYAASLLAPDDYHCLPLGPVLASDLYLRGVQIVPDHVDVTHHGIVYLVRPEAAAEVEQLDDEEPGVGYRCFGGPLRSVAGIEGRSFTNVHTWVPGGGAELLPDGDVRLLPAGSRLVLQVHYFTGGLGGAEPPADLPRVDLWEADGAITGLIETIPLAAYGLFIPAGEPASVNEQRFSFGAWATIVAMSPHMHQLGTQLSVTATGSGGGERCVVDVPDWDFGWQRTYTFPSDQPFRLEPGDAVDLRCVYDNTAANQPVVNGVQQPARDVTWGEGSLDEMCLAYAHVRTPVGAPDGETCGSLPTCVSTCARGDGACLRACMTDQVLACGGCVVGALGDCAPEGGCGAELAPLTGCLAACDDGTLACLVGDCQGDTEAYLACLQPALTAGTCDPDLAACGVSFTD